MKTNKIHNTPLRHNLAASLQDAWHYCTLISPIKGAESAFAGSRDYRGLCGLMSAYDNLVRIVQFWNMHLPAFEAIEVVNSEYINTMGELRAQARKIFKAVELVADANNIDAYNGTFKTASVSNLV